jgi:hypothetical protein
MSSLLFFLLFLFSAATAVLYFANELRHQAWAVDVCRMSFGLCEHFNWLAAATAITAVLFLMFRMADR